MTQLVPGLGEVPSHWTVLPARRVLARQKRPVRSHDEIVTAFRDGQVTLRRLRRSDGFTEALQEIGYHGCRRGDLAVHSMDGFAGAIGVSEADGKMSPVVHLYRPIDDKTDTRFVAYILRKLALSNYIVSLARGIRERSTSFDPAMLADVLLPLPPLLDQRRIADFLDDQVARLDRAIELRRSQVRLTEARLESQRDAAIDALDVPAVALGHLASFLTDGDWIESPFITDSGVRLIQTGNVGRGEYRDQGFRYVSEETFKELGCTSVLPGDVLISRLSAPVGRACLAPMLDGPMIASVDVAILRSNRANHRYLVHALSTRRYLEDVAVASRGTTMARISRSQLSRFRVPLPDLLAQTAVAHRLDAAVNETARAGRVLRSSLDLMQERKQALITAAVTGQFDVTTARAVA